MPYNPTSWVDNVTMGNQTRMNNLETQYTEATNSLNQDLFTAFVVSGYVATKDGTVANKLDVTSGVAWLTQSSDSTLRRRALGASNQTTSALSSTYHLYLQPDGTWYWSTANTPATGSLAIATVTTDGSGNIATVTDARTLWTSLFAGASGRVGIPSGITLDPTATNGETAGTLQIINGGGSPAAGTANMSINNLSGGNIYISGKNAFVTIDQGANISTNASITAGSGLFASGGGQMYYDSGQNASRFLARLSGAANGWAFTSWDGSSFHNVFSLGGQYESASAWIDNTGRLLVNSAQLASGGQFQVNTSGAMTFIGNQASVGSFGAPVIVAQAIDTHVTATTMQTILSYTAPATGLYRISGSVSFSNSASQTLTAQIAYTAAHGGSVTRPLATLQSISGGTTPSLFNQSFNPTFVVDLPILSATIQVASGTAITCQYQDPGGAPNDYVSYIIERLS